MPITSCWMRERLSSRFRYDSIRRCAAALLLAAGVAAALPALAQTSTCGTMDPTGVLAGVAGDFELTVDPDDPAGNVLFVSNIQPDFFQYQNVVVAQIDATTGQTVPGSLTVVANNFKGNSSRNGPEWVRTPQGQLGAIYTSADGVHGVFRAAPPVSWNGFLYDYVGNPTLGSPPVLPSSLPGFYDGLPPKPPQKAATIPMYAPVPTMNTCTNACYGYYNAGQSTDVTSVLQGQYGLWVGGVTQAPWDSYLYVAACTQRTRICGIYQAQIDGQGGFASVQSIATADYTLSSGSGLLQMAAEVHPVNGVPVLFTGETPRLISVWTQSAPGAPLTLLTRVAAPPGAVHYRAYVSDTQVVLNFFVRNGPALGQYTLPVSANGSSLTVGKVTQIYANSLQGSEIQWYRGAQSWAVSFRGQDGIYRRCWFTP
ncbi:MAG: hypothetical protein JSR21_12145 [Proteobacteria bacterium]|nr:hypothetical protein [Pseudomonadota bacterium]